MPGFNSRAGQRGNPAGLPVHLPAFAPLGFSGAWIFAATAHPCRTFGACPFQRQFTGGWPRSREFRPGCIHGIIFVHRIRHWYLELDS